MRPQPLLRRAPRASARAWVAALVASALLALSVGGSAFAARPGGSGSTSGGCSVNPNPVAVGANYTLTGTGLGAYAIVNVLIHDSMGTTSWNLQADGAGTAAVTWHSYATGTSSVTFSKATSKRGSTVVASCSFQVN